VQQALRVLLQPRLVVALLGQDHDRVAGVPASAAETRLL
jgi:hypothetical protein